MVPDLVVFLVFEGDGVDPEELGGDGVGEGEEGGGAEEPDGVVGWVEGDDVFGEGQDTGRVFFC